MFNYLQRESRPARPARKSLSALEKELSAFMAKHVYSNTDPDDEDDPNSEEPSYFTRQKEFVRILADLCDLVRYANKQESDALVERVDDLISNVITNNYDADELHQIFDTDVSSFGHVDGSLIESTDPAISVGQGAVDMLKLLTAKLYGDTTPSGASLNSVFGGLFGESISWKDTIEKPHPSTTPLSRFNKTFSRPWSCPYNEPLAQAVYEARCEVSNHDLALPIKLHLSAGDACLASICMGGWKNRDPLLYTYLLDNDKDKFPRSRHPGPGLESIATQVTTDAPRKLVFIADDERVKSFHWETDLATHTLNSGSKFRGPIFVLSNGSLLRAGRGCAAVWKLDDIETHGPRGSNRIGKKFSVEDSWRDDPEEIERSSGTAPTSKLVFEEALQKSTISDWAAHPSSPNTMLSATEYALVSIDMEHGAKVGTKFIGQGGSATGIETDPGVAPDTFVTGCIDGYIRMWDVRQPLPVLTIAAGDRSNPCAAFAHPGGIPIIFGGCEKNEAVKMWDVRGRKMVYELATGNNRVADIAWDRTRNTLYAATECMTMDRMGSRFDYRPAKIPKWQKSGQEEAEEVDEGDDSEEWEDDEDDEDDEDRAWPQKAFHNEDYFGVAYDAGNHGLLRYQFKVDADPSVIPEYGDAYPGESTW